MADLIACRELRDVNNLEIRYHIEISHPYQDEFGWTCEVRIRNAPAEVSPMKARGVDSYQAVLMAFGLSQGMAHHLNSLVDNGLRFLDMDSNDLQLRILQLGDEKL